MYVIRDSRCSNLFTFSCYSDNSFLRQGTAIMCFFLFVLPAEPLVESVLKSVDLRTASRLVRYAFRPLSTHESVEVNFGCVHGEVSKHFGDDVDGQDCSNLPFQRIPLNRFGWDDVFFDFRCRGDRSVSNSRLVQIFDLTDIKNASSIRILTRKPLP